MNENDWSVYELAREAYEAYNGVSPWSSETVVVDLPFKDCTMDAKKRWIMVAETMILILYQSHEEGE